MRSGVTNVVDVYTDVPTDHQLDLELNAMAVLWESRKEGQSARRLQYSRSRSTRYCPWAKVVSVRKTLGAPHPIDFLSHIPGGNDLIGSRVNLQEKLQLMSQYNPPVTQGNQALVGIFIDGTKRWERSFVVGGLRFDFAGTRRLSAPGGHLVGPGDILPARS